MTVKDYFGGDEMAADVWIDKYKIGDEKTPEDMHRRMAKELSRIEDTYHDTHFIKETEMYHLSEMGKRFVTGEAVLDESGIMRYFDRFRYIVPQGSIMAILGSGVIGSLSNCFVIPSPTDSYGGILKTDQQLVQLMKRRGGVGFNINPLRPFDVPVSNAAGTSTGGYSFCERFSNSTREVAQNGRRGALMLLISCKHPDVFRFVNMKKDRTKVTGANVSVMLTDQFMKAVQEGDDFVCTFPVDNDSRPALVDLEYNVLTQFGEGWIMKIKAKELFDQIVENAWENAEPGIAFMDRVTSYCPEGVYDIYVPIASNPCGEQWMQAYDACRLLAMNLYSLVDKPFTKNAKVNYDMVYQVAYMQQRLADDIVDLELEHVDRILTKIEKDSESKDTKSVEYQLWLNVRNTAKASRRTGCGLTGLGDMLAALGLKYDSDKGLKVIEKVMREKMRGELDCTIDLGILRGTFKDWDRNKEWTSDGHGGVGGNAFYEMLMEEFPTEFDRMLKYGRRNVSWSTVAPTGTVSVMTQTTSGLEPLFLPFYMRRRKVNANEEGVRIDFTDQSGDNWQEYAVLHPKFKVWLEIYHPKFLEEETSKDELQTVFELSPWYGSCANDISWENRIEIQSVIQKYTSNAISSTLNLPSNVDKSVIAGIYNAAWKAGLKGVTVYRDGCRTGVLLAEKKNSFDYSNAVKRPKDIDGNLHVVSVKGIKYGVIIGLLNGRPYELFAFNLPDEIKESCNGKIVKVKKGHYNFECEDGTLRDLQEAAVKSDELVLTRLVSGMLRHGAKPQFVMEQIDKCDLEVVSFGKAVSRTLKKYCKESELIGRSKCYECGSTNLRMEEGCVKCNDCGSSKCG